MNRSRQPAENPYGAGDMETAGIEPAGCFGRDSGVSGTFGSRAETSDVDQSVRPACQRCGRYCCACTVPPIPTIWATALGGVSEKQIPIPLRNLDGDVIAYAVVDLADAPLAKLAWYLDSDPSRSYGKAYARRNQVIEDRRVAVYLHREIMHLGFGDKRQVDHINGLTLDNRRANLRIANHSEQALNQYGIKP